MPGSSSRFIVLSPAERGGSGLRSSAQEAIVPDAQGKVLGTNKADQKEAAGHRAAARLWGWSRYSVRPSEGSAEEGVRT